GWRPTPRPAGTARRRGRRALTIQGRGDSLHAPPVGRTLKDAADDASLRLVNPPLNVAIGRHVLVAKHHATGDVAGPRLADHRIVGPLPGLFALELVSGREDALDNLVDGGLEGNLPLIEIGNDPHSGAENLLHDVAGFRRLSA